MVSTLGTLGDFADHTTACQTSSVTFDIPLKMSVENMEPLCASFVDPLPRLNP